MDEPKLARSQAIKHLRKLTSAPCLDGKSDLPELFPFGIVPPGFMDGKRSRDAKGDRAIVLIIATVLDQALEAAILEKLPSIKPGNEGYIFSDDAAPLRDFDAKIRMAFALGIVGEQVRADLSLMRNIRNVFAHSRMKVNFSTPQVVEACAHLSLPKRKPTFVSPDLDARESFIQTGSTYTIHLVGGSRKERRGDVHASILDVSPERPKPLPPKSVS